MEENYYEKEIEYAKKTIDRFNENNVIRKFNFDIGIDEELTLQANNMILKKIEKYINLMGINHLYIRIDNGIPYADMKIQYNFIIEKHYIFGHEMFCLLINNKLEKKNSIRELFISWRDLCSYLYTEIGSIIYKSQLISGKILVNFVYDKYYKDAFNKYNLELEPFQYKSPDEINDSMNIDAQSMYPSFAEELIQQLKEINKEEDNIDNHKDNHQDKGGQENV